MAPAALKGDIDTMMKFSICAGLAALTMWFASVDAAVAANATGPHILVIDRHTIMTGSKLGENIRQQIMAYEQKAQTDLGAENQALQNQIQAAGAKKSQALQAKEAAFRQKVQDRQSLIQGGEMAARKVYLGAVDAIVHAIMTERGADVVLEKSTVVDSVKGLDITHDAIQRLDKKMASFKVPLVKPPLSEMLQMQQPQQQ
jgi:Skp family chaperone for outer membrane proteins